VGTISEYKRLGGGLGRTTWAQLRRNNSTFVRDHASSVEGLEHRTYV